MTDSALPALDSNVIAQPRALRFPGLVGIFLGFSLCLHLAAVVYYAFSDPLPAAVCVLCGQFLLGLSILRLVDGAFVFQDISLFFLLWRDIAARRCIRAARGDEWNGRRSVHVCDRDVCVQFCSMVVSTTLA